MSRNTPLSAAVIRQIKSAAVGFSGSQAAERIIQAAVRSIGGEITVLDASGFHELFRVGSEGHGGAHVHEPYIQRDTWRLKPGKEGVPLHGKEDYNYYIGKLLQAFETGQYRTKSG